jgi:hypothetical protein
MYISQLVKTRDPHPGLLTIAILFPFHLFYWPESSPVMVASEGSLTQRL